MHRHDDAAANLVVQIPFRVLVAVTKVYGEGVEIWHDYINIPQWQYGVQQSLLAALPFIFSWPPHSLMHLDDVENICI